jgi:hypothetical protein
MLQLPNAPRYFSPGGTSKEAERSSRRFAQYMGVIGAANAAARQKRKKRGEGGKPQSIRQNPRQTGSGEAK